ncbi:periplasmic copper-binding [Methanosphaerula palustris E1-9c]|uniref:Periplasmic copper-binding n=2 Tax=Methanosphaerula palustris TaxID=475088 RepID=B8GFK5_METPE|nr:periplasmic copper-binding [Methanosphaerula palustris E1-9c]
MKGNLRTRITMSVVLGLLVAGLFLISSASAVDVTGPVVIDSPGTYELQKDITSTSEPVCIEIRSSDVKLEGNGHIISGNDVSNSCGVLVHGSSALSNVTVRNIVVKDWYFGVYFWNVKSSSIRNVDARSDYFGISLNPGTGVSITGNILRGNTHGLVLTSSTGTTITDNHIFGNEGDGISIVSSSGNTITNNELNNAKNVGFVGSTGSNTWSGSVTSGRNIIGGPVTGGNYWATPAGDGFSQVNVDKEENGISTVPYTLKSGNVDQCPLVMESEDGAVSNVTAKPVTTKPTTTANVSPNTTSTTSSSTFQVPYVGHILPSQIEAEDYDMGGEGVGYHYSGSSNKYSIYRVGGVKIERNATEKFYYVSNLKYGDWLKYTVSVPQDGTYQLTFRAAAVSDKQYVVVTDDNDKSVSAAAWLRQTLSMDRFATSPAVSIHLTKGTHVLKVFSYGNENIDSFTLSR